MVAKRETPPRVEPPTLGFATAEAFEAWLADHRAEEAGLWLRLAKKGSRAHVADLRATVARRPDDPRLNSLVTELRQGSELFARLWATHDVAVGLSDRKRLEHPVVGMLELDCEVLRTPEHDQRLIVYTAPAGSATAQRLDLLRVLGLQEMAGAARSEPVDLNHVADRAASGPTR